MLASPCKFSGIRLHLHSDCRCEPAGLSAVWLYLISWTPSNHLNLNTTNPPTLQAKAERRVMLTWKLTGSPVMFSAAMVWSEMGLVLINDFLGSEYFCGRGQGRLDLVSAQTCHILLIYHLTCDVVYLDLKSNSCKPVDWSDPAPAHTWKVGVLRY